MRLPVTVWLGPSEHGSDTAMDLIRQMNKSTADSRDEDTISISSLNALGFLMDRQWFRRRWVAQEIAFAVDAFVQCGHSVVRWQEFAHAVDSLQSRKDEFIATRYKWRS